VFFFPTGFLLFVVSTSNRVYTKVWRKARKKWNHRGIILLTELPSPLDLWNVLGRRCEKLVANQRSFKSEMTLKQKFRNFRVTAADHCREEGNKNDSVVRGRTHGSTSYNFFLMPTYKAETKKIDYFKHIFAVKTKPFFVSLLYHKWSKQQNKFFLFKTFIFSDFLTKVEPQKHFWNKK